jgi:alpha,alpha-trehalase
MLGILDDEKTASADGLRYLYVPVTDETAYAYYTALGARHPSWNLAVLRLARGVRSPETRRALSARPGLLSLALRRDSAGTITPLPFVVPGGRFNEMYGWDSYFIIRGLLEDRRVELARAMVDNQVYEITHYGAVLNANRTYYLSRSQPPFLTSAALAVYAALPADSQRREWLAGVLLAAIAEYRGVWMGPDRLTATGLSRYFDTEGGVPPEVEPGHYDAIFAPFAKRHRMTVAEFERAYRAGRVREAALDTFFIHDRSMRESGHDTSYRLLGRSADLATVDLNSLLYKIESDIAGALREIFGGRLQLPGGEVEEAETWERRAERRKELINRFCWDSTQGLFFDYDTRKGERLAYVSATTLYPLWAGLASADQAASVARKALPLLEMPGGVVSSTEASRGALSEDRPARQWDYPYGWAPHQMIAWGGLGRYGFEEGARRLAYRWLYTIVRNAADYNGTVPEKFDVVGRTHEVFAEYGNVGTDFSYIAREGFGWTNASVQCGRALLSESLRAKLNALIPPEWITEW